MSDNMLHFFYSSVIRRLSLLVLTEADLLTRNEEIIKSAQEATETLEKLRKEENLVIIFVLYS